MDRYNFEEYDDPILYDVENGGFNNDIPLLNKWASNVKGTIIELACGTGRATIPLAEKGFSLIGVDIHKEMLTEAKRKSEEIGLQIKWVNQDCTNLQLKAKSAMIYMVGNSFQHFLTNESQEQLLTSITNHLTEKGLFIFNTRFPSVEELLQPPTEEYWRSYYHNLLKLHVDVYTRSEYNSLTQIQTYTIIRRYKNQDGVLVQEKMTNILLRYVFPKEMERLLSSHGFAIENIYGDWKETPIQKDSYQMIYICRKK